MNQGKHEKEKGGGVAVYGQNCLHCAGIIPNFKAGKKFCNRNCKNGYHKNITMIGKARAKSKGIHYAKLHNSPRLQRLLKFLSDLKPHSTREIIQGANICAVNTAVDELRENGFDVVCAYIKTLADGARIYHYQLHKHNN